jgi:hypothetical protein
VNAAKIIVSNDENRAEEAWRILTVQGVKDLYILGGGVNFWLELYTKPDEQSINVPVPEGGDDILHHTFEAALGSKHPAADPDPAHLPKRTYDPKIKLIGPVVAKSGGCG